MSDDLYREIHEEMAGLYVDLHPEVSWDVAYDRTAVAAYDQYSERLAEQADYARMRRLEGN